MDDKTLQTLEYPKILERLAAYAAFSASAELARSIRPTANLEEALHRQQLTSEARQLLTIHGETSVGGARDVRPEVDLAAHGGVLDPGQFLEIKSTLISARDLARLFERLTEQYPALTQACAALPPPPGLIDAITRVLSERGDVLDHASDRLYSIRRELKIAHERLLSRLERLVNDPRNGPMLQEALITQRNGRYVVPLRAEFKGRLRSIVHDQSSSGATLFVEPLAVVDLNNEWHELQLAERDEVRRILAELSLQVGRNAGLMEAMVEALAALDLALACARYADDLHASEPLLEAFKPHPAPAAGKSSKTAGAEPGRDARPTGAAQEPGKDARPTDSVQHPGTEPGRDARPTIMTQQPGAVVEHPGSVLRLYHARHPLLDPATVVPVDIVLDEQTFTVIITGPNTGGKTVTLKTAGLLALMAQSGLHIPAQSGSALTLFDNIYADIGDEQSIEQSLSTFSGHITNIVRILRHADSHCLVLLDELGAGTDPQEGAALARALLAYLIGKRITCLVATHYPELKAFAHSTPGVINASMEFDLHTLRPTYHLTLGLPGRSNALLIAERLGLSKEIVDAARSTIDPSDLKAEDLLDEIHRQRDLARRARSQADRERSLAENLRRELAARLEKVEDERQALLEKARSESAKQVQALGEELEDLRRSLQRARQPLEALKPLQEQVDVMETAMEKRIERKAGASELAPRPLKLGDRVRIRSLGMEGLVTSLGEGEVEVQLGNLRVKSKPSDIQRPGEAPPEPPPTPAARRRKSSATTAAGSSSETTATHVFHPSPGMELDLRGQRAEDALEALDRYIDSAFLAGLPFVRIIHGKGTGKLRQSVREALQASPHAASWETGQEQEGGDGVTVVKIRT